MNNLKKLQFVLYAISLTILSCSDLDSSFQKYRTNETLIEKLLNPIMYVDKKEDTRYLLRELFKESDSSYKKLLELNIINDNSFILYKPNDCITLVTRIKVNEDGTFTDHILVYLIDEFGFSGSIDSLYTLNQDENIVSLHISAKQLNSLINLFIIKAE